MSARAKRQARTVLRLRGVLLVEVDDYARSLLEKTGVAVTRSAAAAALIRLGLQAAEGK